MNELISPKYLMKLVSEVEKAIWDEFESYKNVKNYITKWHEIDSQNFNWENFNIVEKSDTNIDLNQTLHTMPGEILLRIAIDLGVDTPDFIPSIPSFKNELKLEYTTAYDTFIKAFKEIENDPSLAIGLANSTLESIIKEIMKGNRIESKVNSKDTLYKLAQSIIKEFNFIDSEHPIEIRTIGSSLLSACQAIEKIRSENTNFHGKTEDEYLIQDPIYAYFIVNSITTIGLFINKYYKIKYPPFEVEGDDVPF